MPGFGSSGDSFKKKPIFSFGINDKKEVNNNEEGMRTDRRKMSGGILGSGDSHARTHLPLQKSRTEPSLVVDWENIDSRYTKIGRNGYRQKHFVEQFKQLSMNGVDYSPEIRRNGRETSNTTTDRTGGSVTVKNVSENSGNGERCESMSNKTKKSESLGKGAGNSVVCDTDTYAGRRDVSDPASVLEKQIVSSRGTVRGFKNRVRAGIATFLQHQEGNIQRNYRILEKGKIIIYTTSMTVIRRSNERCKKVKKILQNHMVRYEERDMFMSKENQKELTERLGNHSAVLPQVFADGSPLGSLEQLEKMNESGELRHLLKNFTKIDVKSSCDKCGGYRFIPCVHCHGSKKSLRRNNFTDEFCALRCMQCDENGLQRCDLCLDQQE